MRDLSARDLAGKPKRNPPARLPRGSRERCPASQVRMGRDASGRAGGGEGRASARDGEEGGERRG